MKKRHKILFLIKKREEVHCHFFLKNLEFLEVLIVIIIVISLNETKAFLLLHMKKNKQMIGASF